MSTLKTDLVTDYDRSGPLGHSEAYQLLTGHNKTPRTSTLAEQAYQHALHAPISDTTIRNLYHLLVLRTHTDMESPYQFWVYFLPDGTLVDVAPWAEETEPPPSPLEKTIPQLTMVLYHYGSVDTIVPWTRYARLLEDLPAQLREWIRSFT